MSDQGESMKHKALHGKVSTRAQKANLTIFATAFFVFARMVTAVASPPLTLTCPDAGGAQIFLLDIENARVVSATGIWHDSNRREQMFKNVSIHATETALTWQWVQERKSLIRTYVLDRNTLELKVIDRATTGEQGPYFELRCILSKRQL
jgi:hypothetical protein